MTLLFLLMILAIFFGGLFLWLSGLFSGLRFCSASGSSKKFDKLKADHDTLVAEVSRIGELLHQAETQAKQAQEARKTMESEMARESVELGRAEGELKRYEAEIKRLKEENEALATRKPTSNSAPEAKTEPLVLDGREPTQRHTSPMQTMAISTRGTSIPATTYNLLKQQHERLQTEKEKMEAELLRAQQEIQLLKVRKS